MQVTAKVDLVVKEEQKRKTRALLHNTRLACDRTDLQYVGVPHICDSTSIKVKHR